jgi:hypothetical protein
MTSVKEQADGVLGDLLDAIIGLVREVDPRLGERLHIHIVIADSVADDQLDPLPTGD